LLLTIGPGGDEGRPLGVDLARAGGLLVAGPPGSGRTAAVDAFAAQLRDQGIPLLRLCPRATAATGGDWIDPADEASARAWAEALGDGPGVVLIDDLGSPVECAGLTALVRPGNPSDRIAVIAAGQPAQLAAHYQGPVAALRRARSGLLLCPGPGDADLLGVRLPRTPVPVRPGSGWLVTGGAVERVQVARRRAGAAARP
jgi:S-DNA-T family DNA segregation ATPase FtsK/SpoIIIE